MHSVSVLVPWRPDGGHRDRAWQWVARRWAQHHPGWQIVTGTPPDGPWCKAAAVADALDRADGNVLVVADSDVWCDGIGQAVTMLDRGAPWAIPHDKVHRLGEVQTIRVLAGTDPEQARGPMARQPYTGVEGGGMVALPRRTYETAPLDPRFRGWGSEDEAWGVALRCLAGKPWRGEHPLWHLHHPPQPRLNAHVGNRDSHALHVRYQQAARSRPAMRRLIAEHTGGS